MTDNLKVGLEVTADTADADAKLKHTGDTVEGVGTSGKQAAAGVGQAGASIEQTGEKSEKSESFITELRRGLVELAAATYGVEGAKALTEIADEAQNAAAKIRLVTKSDEEFQQVQQALLNLSLQTRTSYTDNVTFYQRLYNATKSLTDAQGQQLYNSQDLIRVQTTLNEALQLSGATSTEATNGLIQLSQGLASGRLQGQDLRAVLDDIPGVANALADGLGVSIGKLRALATAGQLTPEEVVNALLKEGEAVDEQFKTLPETVGGAITNLKTQFLAYVGQVNQGTGASQELVSLIESLARNMDLLGNAAEVGAAAGIAKLAKETVAYLENAVAARQATAAEQAAQLQLADAGKAAAAAAAQQATATQALAQQRLADAEAARAEASSILAGVEADLEMAAARRALVAANRDAVAAQASLTAAQTAYRDVATAGSATTKLLAGGISGLVSNVLNLGVAFEAGEQFGDLLYKKFEIVRQGANLLVEGLLLAKAEVFGTAADVKAIEENFRDADTSAADFGKSASAAGNQAADGAAAAKNAVDGLLGTLTKSSEATAQQTVTLDTLAKKLQSLTQTELATFTAKAQSGFDDATQRVKALTDQMDALSGRAAVDFINANLKAFEAASNDAEQFGKVLETVRAEDLRQLGVDADLVRTQIDQAMTKSIVAVNQLGSISTTTAAEMNAAFEGALARATTQQDAEALIAAVGNVKVAGFDAAAAIAQIKQRMSELPSAAESLSPVTAALTALGVESEQALQRAAKAANDNFAIIEQSGTQAAGIVDQAFAKMADAQLKAAAASGSSSLSQVADSLKVQAADDSQRAALEKLVAAYPALAKASADTAKQQVADAKAAASAIASEFASLKSSIGSAADVDQIHQIQQQLTQLYANGKISADEYRGAVEAATQKEEELGRAAGGVASALANIIEPLRAQFAAMSDAAAAEFDAVEQHAVVYGESVQLFLQKYTDGVDALLAKSKEETAQAQALTAALSNTSSQTLLNVQLAQSAAQSFKYLDQTTLSDLNNAITAAKQNLDGLRQSADQTLSDLQDQLDQLNGNTLAIEERQNAAKQASIQQQLQAARQAGDQQSIGELQQSLQLLQQIGQVQQQQATQQNTASTPSTAAPVQGRYEITLNIGGQSVPVYADTQAQAEQLVAALQNAQSTSVVQ